MMEINLSNKTYMVTGATAGIGLAVAELLVRRGAALIGVGRSTERCRAAEKHLHQLRPDGQVQFLTGDLSLQSEVRRLASQAGEALDAWDKTGLDGMVNNAGTFTYWFTQTPEGFEMQWAVNHLAPFLLTRQMLPRLQAAPAGRVVTVSSDSHYGARLNWEDLQLRRRYNGLRAYGNTKLANILFTLELDRRMRAGSNVRAFAADPGLVKTDIGLKGTPLLAGLVWKLRRSGGITPEESAEGIVYLLTAPAVQDQPDLYWKHGRPKRASRFAQDGQAARRLWDLSEQMCGIQTEVQHVRA